MIEFLLFVIAWRLWFKPKNEYKYYSKLPTDEQNEQIRIVVINTLLRYPDSPVGDNYPEIRYAVLSELYKQGEISKEYMHEQIDKII